MKVRGLEIEEKTFSTRDSRAIPHLSTNLARRNLISECGMGSDACCRGMAECIRLLHHRPTYTLRISHLTSSPHSLFSSTLNPPTYISYFPYTLALRLSSSRPNHLLTTPNPPRTAYATHPGTSTRSTLEFPPSPLSSPHLSTTPSQRLCPLPYGVYACPTVVSP